MRAQTRAAALCLFASAILAGCGSPVSDPDVATAERVARERIRRELGMTLPVHASDPVSYTDGGTMEVRFVDARGFALVVYRDGRLMPGDGPVEDALANRQVCLHAYPTESGAVRLGWGSPAESAVVDLVRSAVRALVTPERESTLVREDAWTRTAGWESRARVREIERGRTDAERRVLALRQFAAGLEARRALILEWSTRFTPEQKQERIRRELGLAPPYVLRDAGHAPDGGTGIAHFKDPQGHALWVYADAHMGWPGGAEGLPPPVRHVWVNSREDRDSARRLDFSTPAESAVVDLMDFVLAEGSIRPEHSTPEAATTHLWRIRGRIRNLPAEALEARAAFLESAERLGEIQSGR